MVIDASAILTTGGNMSEYHGDELEIEAEHKEDQEAYENEHADDWEYSQERLDGFRPE